MLVTIPFMCRVVSVHRLYTATCFFGERAVKRKELVKITSSPPAKGRMSCSTVSDVNTASSPSSCAWMSCGYLVGRGAPNPHRMPTLNDPLLAPAGQPHSILHSLWGALLQAFTVEDTFQRKIK